MNKKTELLYMGQASIRLVTAEGKVIYIDPYAGSGYDLPADLILITHDHYDHCDLDKVIYRNKDCKIITWEDAVLSKGRYRNFDLDYVKVEPVEAGYNRWHSSSNCVGYVLTLSVGIKIYVSGDTAKTKQMSTMSEMGIDYAFYCCDGLFTMDLKEAAECAKLVGAKHNIPYHVTIKRTPDHFDRRRAEQFEVSNRLILEPGKPINI